MLELEKYHGSGSRHTCPACGRAKKFSRYVDSETGRHVADYVGRCDRESSCGYHLKPTEYFAENQTFENLRKPTPGPKRETRLERNDERRFSTKKPDYIEPAILTRTLVNYERNSFVQFLLGLFPFDPDGVWQAVRDYLIGTTKNGKAIFWQIDQKRKIRTGKIIEYDPATGKRNKRKNPNWAHSELKKAGTLNADFELRQCFFGEHLLPKYPGLPIAIVEAEKSAVIGSICKGVFPDMVWLACGGKSNLNADWLERLGRDRKILLFPDADGFDKWREIASDASKRGLTVNASDLIEIRATNAENAKGFDLADYLIREQARRNDPANREAFRDLIEERLAIMTIDNGLSEEQAEGEIIASRFYAEAIRAIVVAYEEPKTITLVAISREKLRRCQLSLYFVI